MGGQRSFAYYAKGQSRYDYFDLKGEYRIGFYTVSRNGDVSFPETLTINQSQGKTVIPTFYVGQSTLFTCVTLVVNGQYFQAALESLGDKFVLVARSQAAKQFSLAALCLILI